MKRKVSIKKHFSGMDKPYYTPTHFTVMGTGFGITARTA
jgi:hypothetical protein